MSNEEMIKNMIEFIENKEQEFQSNTLNIGSQMKNDAVKAILDELERMTNEN